ncbi:MAG: hypothetical protein AAFX79_04400 [Planctomycetota bacterium]
MSTDPVGPPEGVSDEQQGFEAYSLETKRKIPVQLVVVAVVLVVAGGVIYWMHLRGTSPAKKLKPVEMKFTIEQTQARHFEGEERIMRELTRSGPPPQVPLEDIDANPFQLDRTPDVQEAILTGQPEQTVAPDIARAERLLDNVVVEMVLDNPRNPLAKINGTIYRLGHEVDGMLEVVGISGRSVTLRYKTVMRTIEMDGK